MRLSRLAQAAKVSGTLAIDEEFRTRKAQGEDVISLGAGQPDFPSPPAAQQGGIEAIETGRTRYTDVCGTPELRAAIARKLKEENGLAVTPKQVVVTAGAKQAIYHERIDTATEVLGTKLAMPVMTAPCGGMRLVHSRQDLRVPMFFRQLP